MSLWHFVRTVFLQPLFHLGNSAGISIKRNALPGILTEVLLFLNPDECAKIKPIRAEGKGENHVYDCGLGNPGKEYNNTRHNIGCFIDALAQEYDINVMDVKLRH